MTQKSTFKSFLEKAFDESLESSTFMQKVVDSITIVANETKKVAELMLRINDRLNQHEKIILMLLDVQNEKQKKEQYVDHVSKSKEGSSKPN